MLVTAWSDRIGTHKVLALLATSWAIVQLATVFVFTFPGLLLSRTLLGAGEGPSYGTSVSAVTPWLPAKRRAFGPGVVTFGSAIGPALFAPPLTFLIVFFGWRAAFALLGGIGLLWVIIQAAGRNTASGFSHAYLLSSLLLLIGGSTFLAFARPDDERREEKFR